VSDLRAPTPTAAAELSTPDQTDLRAELWGVKQQLQKIAIDKIRYYQSNLGMVKSNLSRYTPLNFIKNARQHLDDINHLSNVYTKHQIDIERSKLAGISQRFEALSPEATLARGFAIVSGSDNRIIRSIGQIQTGISLNVRVSDGQFGVEVTNASLK